MWQNLTSFEYGGATRTLKGMDWEVLGRLHEKGYIGNPKSKEKSVVFSEEGFKRSEQLFEKHFGFSVDSVQYMVRVCRQYCEVDPIGFISSVMSRMSLPTFTSTGRNILQSFGSIRFIWHAHRIWRA
jgi:hypothetical protein